MKKRQVPGVPQAGSREVLPSSQNVLQEIGVTGGRERFAPMASSGKASCKALSEPNGRRPGGVSGRWQVHVPSSPLSDFTSSGRTA